MNKYLIGFLLLIAFLLSYNHIGEDDYTNIRDSVVKVYDEEGDSIGSGVVVEEGRVLTAWHVVKDRETWVLGRDGDTRYQYKVIWYNERLDLAELYSGIKCPCTPLANKTGERDEKVVTVGYPLNYFVQTQILTEGRDQGISRFDDLYKRAMTSPIIYGNSGGGVFVYRRGRWQLIGIAVSIAVSQGYYESHPVPHISFYTPITNKLRWGLFHKQAEL